MMTAQELLYNVLKFSSETKVPDIHLNSGHFPMYRNHSGEITTITEVKISESETVSVGKLDESTIKEIITEIAGVEGLKKAEENIELDLSYPFETGDRYRVNCYRDTNGYSIAMRIIPRDIPSLESLGLGEKIKEMCGKSKGLILVTGPTGSGKSTNLAAMIEYINQTQKKHIITIEDPVEFGFHSDKSLINQREIGSHTQGFSQALRAALREDPDIIMVGEMRDPETIKAALTLAETGHLVLSTLHTNDSVQTVDRIVDIFPTGQQKQIRMQLAMSLVGIMSQRLLPRSDKPGRVAAREILLSNDATRALIIAGKTHQLYSVLEVGQKEGMILMDKYLLALFNKKMISREVLFSYVRDKESVEMLIS